MARMHDLGTWRIGPVTLVVAVALVLPLAGCAAPASTQTSGQAAPYGVEGKSATSPSVGNQDLATSGVAREAAVAPDPGGSGVDASTIPATQKLMVYNKTFRLEVKDVEGTIAKIRELAKRDSADITQMQVASALDAPIYRPLDGAATAPSSTSSNPALRAFVTIRVPADKYQAFIDDAAKLGVVKVQFENADDVTQQHVDLKARLDNLRAQEARLREFFIKAKNVAEMLQIEQELARVRGEIESLAAQVAYLERQAAMATVTLELTEPQALVRPAGVDWGTGKAFTDGVRAFVGTLNILIVMLGPILALGIFIVLPTYLVARFVWKRYTKHRAAKAAQGQPQQPSDPAA
jgi:hypothetical protein